MTAPHRKRSSTTSRHYENISQLQEDPIDHIFSKKSNISLPNQNDMISRLQSKCGCKRMKEDNCLFGGMVEKFNLKGNDRTFQLKLCSNWLLENKISIFQNKSFGEYLITTESIWKRCITNKTIDSNGVEKLHYNYYVPIDELNYFSEDSRIYVCSESFLNAYNIKKRTIEDCATAFKRGLSIIGYSLREWTDATMHNYTKEEAQKVFDNTFGAGNYGMYVIMTLFIY